MANNWLESDYKLYFEPFANCIPQVFFALGNHELSNATMEDVSVIYDDLLANKTYLQGNPEGFYYYFDDTGRKIRYLVINTSDGIFNRVTDEQIAWIQESVQLPTSSWKLVVFGHYDIMPNDPITNEWNSNRETKIVNALKTTNGVFIGYFCGHEHFDRIVAVDDSFYQITLLNDSCVKDTEFDVITNPDRTAGTVSEQAVSIVSINTSTGDVTIRRIGAGENMTYNYLDIVDEPIPTTYVVTRNLTNCKSSSTITSIEEGSAHTETITANSGYTLTGATVSITMGGKDISSSYSNGVLNISSVTGNIVITVSAVQETTEPDVTLSSISATYTGGDVPVGTALTSLTGIVVTAYYSDGSSINVTEYTLSGMIAEGSNTITVAYNGKTTTFTVTGIKAKVSGTTEWFDGVPYDIVNTKTDGICIENGVETPYDTWSATDYLYCFGAYKCVCSTSWFINPKYGAFYDENKNYISQLTGSDYNISEFIIPNNAYYFRVSSKTNNFETVTITPYATE